MNHVTGKMDALTPARCQPATGLEISIIGGHPCLNRMFCGVILVAPVFEERQSHLVCASAAVPHQGHFAHHAAAGIGTHSFDVPGTWESAAYI